MEKEEISPLATDIIPGKDDAVLEMADGGNWTRSREKSRAITIGRNCSNE